MLQAARSAKKKLLYVRFVQIKSDPENTIPTIAFGIEGLSNFCNSHSVDGASYTGRSDSLFCSFCK